MASNDTQDIWALLEQTAPTGCEAVQDLYSWSLNYDAGKGPFALFLDLIGYSEDEYGCELYNMKDGGRGYVELSKLAAALEEYSTLPGTVYAYADTLIAAEIA